jgi:hypothetical protein
MPLDLHALKIQFLQQLLEHGALMVVASAIAGLGDRHTQGCGVLCHLDDKRRSATTGGLNRAALGLTVSDQLIHLASPTWDLSDRPITDGGADGIDIHP